MIKKTFQKFDIDGNGTLSLSELKEVLQLLPVAPGSRRFNDADFQRFLNIIDENHDGVIDYHEFTDWIHHDGDDAHEIMKRMKSAPSTLNVPGKGGVRGPERFFYDQSTYTGTHNGAGPTIVSASGRNTSVSDPAGDCGQGGKCTFKFARCTKCGRGEGAVGSKSSTRPVSAGRAGRRASSRSVSPRPGGDGKPNLVGPERFFYDQSTYTGTAQTSTFR